MLCHGNFLCSLCGFYGSEQLLLVRYLSSLFITINFRSNSSKRPTILASSELSGKLPM